MTVRFNCWVKADSLPDAWEKLEEICGDVHNKVSWKFTATVLEDPEEDMRSMEEFDIALAAKSLRRDLEDLIQGKTAQGSKNTRPYKKVLRMMERYGL